MSKELKAIENLGVAELAAKTGDELLRLVDEAEAELEKARTMREWLESVIAYKYVYRTTQLRSEMQLEYGSVQFEDGVVKVTAEIPRAVTWDQKKLHAIARLIQEQGEDPAEFMDVAYDVPEDRFDVWPDVIQNSFKGALTIKAGHPSHRLSHLNKLSLLF